MLTRQQLEVRNLGACTVESQLSVRRGGRFVPDAARLLHRIDFTPDDPIDPGISLEKAGPRQRIFFQPENVRAAIVTCGGLCPGLNNVIRSVFFELFHYYGVKRVVGVRHGYQGFNPAYGHALLELSAEAVEHIHKLGGTLLGSSRGPQDAKVIVDFLEKEGVNVLFCVGGDGTLRGAHAICEESSRRNLRLAIVGIPKTIDNDISFVWQSFGYITAVEKAREALDGAHAEAKASPNGISLVKLMGRDAGFIAAGATVASQEVNYTLIPEVPFRLEGEGGFLEHLKQRILTRKHALIVVAEGAGQGLLESGPAEFDASGNFKHGDIGAFLNEQIRDYFCRQGIPVVLRYIDPSYLIRSTPANTGDSLLCDQLARNAVHAAMAGKTDLIVGSWQNHFVHVPIEVVVQHKKRLREENELWAAVLEATGQPARFGRLDAAADRR
jgi:6-phosphofructokinase 1